MNTLGEAVKTVELFDIAARTATVGTYGSKVYDRKSFRSCVAVLNSAASSAGSSVSLDVKLQASDVLATGSKSNATGSADSDIPLRYDTNDNVSLAMQVTQSGARQIAKVFVKLKKTGTITSGKIVTCRLETNNAGDPSGTLVHADATVDVETDDISSSYGFIEFAFARPVDIANSTVFHIVLTGDYTLSTSNHIKMAVETVGSGGDFNIYDSSWGGVSATASGVAYIEQYSFSDISGATFTTVDETAALHEAIEQSLLGTSRYLRALATVAGGSASFQCGASLILGECNVNPVAG